jgi:hypothetical protein
LASNSETQITVALEEVVASKFPMRSACLDLTVETGRKMCCNSLLDYCNVTGLGKEYSRIFKAWLDAFVLCGSMDLLEPLMSSFREGVDHVHVEWIRSAITSFVNSIDYDDSSDGGGVSASLIVCRRCIEIVLDPETDMTVKLLFFDDICLAVLLKCTSRNLCELCTSSHHAGLLEASDNKLHNTLVCQLMTLIVDNSNVISQLDDDCDKWTEDTEQLLLRILCSYTIIERLYDRFDVFTAVPSTFSFL